MIVKALKKKSTIIVASIISALIIVFYVVSIVLEQAYVIELPYSITTTFAFILIILLLIAFVVGDQYAANYRRKNKLWSGALPEEIKQKVWDLITPWLIVSIVTILIATLDTILWRIG
ncbi:MAG: hypothetical protein J1F31_04660 [Erysipelotrichales bacterium]|nr:hypothetical protein [Erysipelotrichales bacterium]